MVLQRKERQRGQTSLGIVASTRVRVTKPVAGSVPHFTRDSYQVHLVYT
jgi:hypothetical protein